MSEKRKPSGLFALLRRKGSKENGQATLERQVSAQPTRLHHSRSDLNQKEAKVRKPVERRESSRLQNAAKLLRNLSKSKDLSLGSSSISLHPASPASEVGAPPAANNNQLNRSHPVYHSEGKGARRRRSEGREREVKKDRSHSFHGKVDKKNKYTSLSQANLLNAEKKVKEETVQGARSILLTEDNLNPLADKSPDLIQDLPYLDLPPRCGTATPPGHASSVATPPGHASSVATPSIHASSLATPSLHASSSSTATPPGRCSLATPSLATPVPLASCTPPPVPPSPAPSSVDQNPPPPPPPLSAPPSTASGPPISPETVALDLNVFEDQLEEHEEKVEEITDHRSLNGERRSDDSAWRAPQDEGSDETTYKGSDDATYRGEDDTAFTGGDDKGSEDPTYSTIDERYNSNDSLHQWEETYLQPEEEGHYEDMGGRTDKHADDVKMDGGKYTLEDVEDSYVTSLEEERMRDSIPTAKQSNNFFSPVNHNLESADDEYISHIRSSSYALLSNANDRRLFCEAKANYSNVQSGMYHAREDQQHFPNYTTRMSGNAQSLPYIGHQALSLVTPITRNQNSNELEEYARKYEAIQRQSSRRTNGTPFIDQLKKESQKTVFWRREEEICGRDSTSSSYSTQPSPISYSAQPSPMTSPISYSAQPSPSFQSSHHGRQSSNGSIKAESPAFTGYHPPPHSLHLPRSCQTPPQVDLRSCQTPPQPSSQQNGRESSTSSVMSDSSSETLRYGEPGQGYQSSVNSSKASSPQQEHSSRPLYSPDTPLHRSDQQQHKQNHARTVTKELTTGPVATRAKPTKHGPNDARRKSDYFLTSEYSRSYSYSDQRSERKNTKNDCEDLSATTYHSSLSISSLTPPKPTQAQPSVSERISHIEKYGLSAKQTSHPDYHLSKSVPNLVSENGSEDCGDESADRTDVSDNPPPANNYTYFDPDKTMKVSDNTLKMIQKQALLAYYQRQRTLPKEEGKPEENVEENQHSVESGHKEYERTFLRSISHGSLSNGQYVSQGLGTRTPSQTSLASTRTSRSEIGSAKYGGMLPSHQKIEFPQNCQSIQRSVDLERRGSSDENSRLQAWKSKKDPVRSMAIPPLLPDRNPTPDLPPPPPPEGHGEFVCSDEPLPPPPLRIEEDDRVDSSSLAPDLELLKKMVPKRNSPATIAAKEAPGWDKFLGGNTSNISFTSDVARKFRRTKDKMRAKAREPKSLPYDLTSNAGLKPLHAAKSSPSLHERGLEPSTWWKTSMDSLRTSSSGDYYPPSSRNTSNINNNVTSGSGKETTVSHSHSNSDSGLSSLSGRTSCMSPMSTVSSVSSASSGSSRASLRSASIVSSSTIPLDEDEEDRALCGGRRSQKEDERTSGRRNQKEEERALCGGRRSQKEEERAMCTIRRSQKEQEKLCDMRRSQNEEERAMSSVRRSQSVVFRDNLPEEEAVDRLANDLFNHIKMNAETRALFGGADGEAKTSADYLKGVFGPDHDAAKGKQSNNNKDAGHVETSSATKEEHTATEVAVKKNELISRISKKLSVLKAEQASLKDETRANDESGRVLLARIQEVGSQAEVDKYRLHVEEMDKITSLLLGLAGRLAKAEEAWKLAKHEGDESQLKLLKSKKEKLEEQLVEAKELKSSIDRRSVTVSLMIQKYLDLEEFRNYQTFVHLKCQLIVDKRQIGERIAISEQQLQALKNNATIPERANSAISAINS